MVWSNADAVTSSLCRLLNLAHELWLFSKCLWITSLKSLNKLNYNVFSCSLASARFDAMSLAHAQAINFCRSLSLAKFVARSRSGLRV